MKGLEHGTPSNDQLHLGLSNKAFDKYQQEVNNNVSLYDSKDFLERLSEDERKGIALARTVKSLEQEYAKLVDVHTKSKDSSLPAARESSSTEGQPSGGSDEQGRKEIGSLSPAK